MCGIAGYGGFSDQTSLHADLIQKMNDKLACRGPDQEGHGSART
jgi:asparagine synthetase B (glutamine-hydrolysing)